MGIPIQTPTLAELLATYQAGQIGNGVAAGVNQGMANFNTTARTTSQIQAEQQAAAVAKQQADTAEMERRSQIVSPEDVSGAMNGQAPTHPVNQTFADTILKAKQAADLKASQIKSQEFEAEQNRLARQAVADQANRVHQDAIAATSMTSANSQLETAAKNKMAAHSWLPWETANEKTAGAVFNNAAQRAGMMPSSNAVYRHFSDGHSEVSTDGGKTFKPVVQ